MAMRGCGRSAWCIKMAMGTGALRESVVPLDLFGKARTTWKVGIFTSLQFWTRISCRFLFNYPGNGTAMPIDCRSKSP